MTEQIYEEIHNSLFIRKYLESYDQINLLVSYIFGVLYINNYLESRK